jgi:hypothetical protein
MSFDWIRVLGTDAIRVINEHRTRYPATRQYPFLIGDTEELERLFLVGLKLSRHE